MFAVNNQPTTYKFTAPLEQHGQEPKSSTSLRFKLNLHSAILAAFHSGLRAVLYRKFEAGEQGDLPAEHPDGLTKLALPKLAPLVIDDILPGYTLGMTAGLDCSDVHSFDAVKLSNFRLEPLNGGTVEVQVSAHFHPSDEEAGWIYGQQGKEMQITLQPPAAGTVEEPSPQRDLVDEAARKNVLVTALEVTQSGATHLFRVKCALSDGDVETVGDWAYRPSIDEIAMKLSDELDASIEFTPAVRNEYETVDA